MRDYTLRVAERDDNEGVTADLYGPEGTIQKTAGALYENHGMEVEREESPDPIERDVTADAMALQIETQRLDSGFDFRLLGDGEELERVRVRDSEWDLTGD